jgi:hypothetical protein
MPASRRLASLILLVVILSSKACQPSPDQTNTVDDLSEQTEDQDDTALVLVPGEDHYHLARLDIGALAISLDTIVPAGAGVAVRLVIGNTLAAGLEDLSATLQWGPLEPDGVPQLAAERTREVPIASVLHGGRWTSATITLADIPPNEVRFIRLANLDYTGLILR